MRQLIAQAMEAVGFAFVVACTFGLLGTWAALGIAGAGLLLAGAVLDR